MAVLVVTGTCAACRPKPPNNGPIEYVGGTDPHPGVPVDAIPAPTPPTSPRETEAEAIRLELATNIRKQIKSDPVGALLDLGLRVDDFDPIARTLHAKWRESNPERQPVAAPRLDLDVGASAAASPSPSGPRIQVRNGCILGDRTLLFHVAFDVAYSASQSHSAYKSRQLYQFKCELRDGMCSGMRLNLDELDAGGTLDAWDLDEIGPRAVLTATGSTFVVKWPTLRTFSLDLSRRYGVVRYVESGEGLVAGHVEGRAESVCDLGDVRTCSRDADCLPASECLGSHKCGSRLPQRPPAPPAKR
jgi:hypothetical protein